MGLGGFVLGLALPEPAAEAHGLDPVVTGHRTCMTIRTDDVAGAYSMALEAGARQQRPAPYLDGRLRIALVEDPDGHPVQLVQSITR